MQHCDSTCQHCFRQFVAWLKSRMWQQDQPWPDSNSETFNQAAATSVRPNRG